MQFKLIASLLIMGVIMYPILLFIDRVLEPKDRKYKKHRGRKIIFAIAAVPMSLIVFMIIDRLQSHAGLSRFYMFGWVAATLLAYCACRSRFRLVQLLVPSAVVISAIILGYIFGKNYFYGSDQAGSIGGAVSFTIIAVPEILLGCLAGRMQWSLSMTFLIACLSSPLILLIGGIVMLFVALFGGFPV